VSAFKLKAFISCQIDSINTDGILCLLATQNDVCVVLYNINLVLFSSFFTLTRTLFQNLANYRFDNMRGKARDILIL
jgi:hypothetical protein